MFSVAVPVELTDHVVSEAALWLAGATLLDTADAVLQAVSWEGEPKIRMEHPRCGLIRR